MDCEKQFKRPRHGQIIKLMATISGQSTTNASVLRLSGYPVTLGPGKLGPKCGQDKFKFVVEFVQPTPDPLPVVASDVESTYPDHVRLRTLEPFNPSYLSFEKDGVLGLSLEPTMNTEIYFYPGKFATYFKLESVKFPGSVLQCGYKDGAHAAHGVTEEGGRCSILQADSLFASTNKAEMLVFDPKACPPPKATTTPGQQMAFKAFRCVGHKRVLVRGHFDHAAFKFLVVDSQDCARHVWHRFSVVSEFAKELSKESNRQLPAMPEKGSMFSSKDDEALMQARQAEFDKWCTDVVELNLNLSQTRAFEKFTQDTEVRSVAVVGGAVHKRQNGSGAFTHAAYQLQVSYQGLSWATQKRYSDLAGAVSKLQREFSDQPEVVEALARFPSKTNVRPQGWGKNIPSFLTSALSLQDHSCEKFLEERKARIHQWLDAVAHFPQVGRNRVWLAFLCKQ